MLVCAWGRACRCLPVVLHGGHGRPPLATQGPLMHKGFAGTALSGEHLHQTHISVRVQLQACAHGTQPRHNHKQTGPSSDQLCAH